MVMENIGVILLAAGCSSRMGKPKQLLPWRQTTLLRHMTAQATDANDGPVMVVLGNEAQKCGAVLQDLPVQCALNPRWEEGMGSSIVRGLEVLLHSSPHMDAVVVMLCDQVEVDASLIKTLILTYQSNGADMIMCEYGGTKGPPALFSRRMFTDLLALQGSSGARHLWEKAAHKTLVPFPAGIHDLDTPDQYEQYHQTVVR